MTAEEAAKEYMKHPVIKAAIKFGDVEDMESHIKIAFKNGAEWQKTIIIDAVKSALAFYTEGITYQNVINDIDCKLNDNIL